MPGTDGVSTAGRYDRPRLDCLRHGDRGTAALLSIACPDAGDAPHVDNWKQERKKES